jgi:hypothetical protein
MRTPDEVFREETIASFNGKPVVNDHPEPSDAAWDVNPDNWNQLAIGTVLSPRRGAGSMKDFLLADFVITNKDAIREILDGKREVSCGYLADYLDYGGGRGEQKNIIGNHVALVDKARCGVACSIGDQKTGDAKMTLLERLKAAFTAKDQAGFDKALAELPAGAALTATRDEGGGIHFHMGAPNAEGGPGKPGDRKYTDEKLDDEFKKLHDGHKAFTDAYTADMKGVRDGIEELKNMGKAKEKEGADAEAETKEIEGALKEEAPVGTGDAAAKATDSQYLAGSFQETIAAAEIIAPGIHLPTFDKAENPRKTFVAICGLRRKALQLGNNDPATNAMITNANGNRELTTDGLKDMPCANVKPIFNAVSAMKRAANAKDATKRSDASAATTPSVVSIADVNKANAAYWKNR